MNLKPDCKFTIPLAWLILILLSKSTAAQIKINLQQAIDSSLAKNLQIRASKINEELSEQDVIKAKTSLYPNLNFNVTSNLSFGRSLDPTTYNYITQTALYSSQSLTSNIVLFQGFQKLNLIKENKLLLESNINTTLKLKNDLVLRVIMSYLGALNYKNQLKAANQQLDFAKEQLGNETKNFKAGKKMLADLSRAKYQISKIEVDVTTANNQLNNSMIELYQEMNLDPSIKLELIDPEFENIQYKNASVTDIYNYAVANFPEIKAAQFNRLATIKQLHVIRAGFYPYLTLSGNVASNFAHTPQVVSIFTMPSESFFNQIHTNLYEYIGLNLSIPIFNNFNNNIAVKKAKLNIITAEINEENAKQVLYKIINQATNDLETAKKDYQSALDSYESAKETFKVIEKRYKTGLASSLDFMQSQNEMNQAEFAIIYYKYDLILKSKVINFYQGKPIQY